MQKDTLKTLIKQLNDGSISAADREKLMNFYNSYQFAGKWDEKAMGNEAEVKDKIFADLQDQMLKAQNPQVISMTLVYRLAAACVLVLCMSWLAYTMIFRGTTMIVVESGKSKRAVLLPDGSKITLNVNSKLTYPEKFANARRDVQFEGEGFFEVQTDPAHPFVVSTSHVKVRVLGTAFNLKAYEDDPTVETSLIHGKVEVLTPDEEHTLSTLIPNHKFIAKKNVLINNSFSAAKSQEQVVPMEYIDMDKKAPVDVAWKEGKFAFASSTFGDIAREIHRQYGVEIVFENQDAAAYKYTATFEHENVLEVLQALRMVKPFSYRKEGSKIVIY